MGLGLSLGVACAVFGCTDGAPSEADATGGAKPSGGEQPSSGGVASGGRPAGGANTNATGGTVGSSGGLGGLGGNGGDRAGTTCPADEVDGPAPPDLLDGSEASFFRPVRGEEGLTCPMGTVPSERFTCVDVELCACEYPCADECGSNEVCSPGRSGNACSCHPALEGAPGDCRWTGLFAEDVFSDCDAWRFTVSSNGQPTTAEVIDGALHMAVQQRCQNVFAQVGAQRPPIDAFPEGAALVFDYRAQGEPSDAQPQPAEVFFESTFSALPPSDELREHRLCVRLDRYPATIELRFSVANHGTCIEVSPAELWVSNVRLEADSTCGR